MNAKKQAILDNMVRADSLKSDLDDFIEDVIYELYKLMYVPEDEEASFEYTVKTELLNDFSRIKSIDELPPVKELAQAMAGRYKHLSST